MRPNLRPGPVDPGLAVESDVPCLAEGADAPRQTAATTTAAAATSAAATTSAAPAASAAASAATTTAATSSKLLAFLGAPGVLLVEDVERPQADVGNLLLIESEAVIGRDGL